MPRIEAETVAEHRARQRDALLDAAKRILLEGGYEALTFQALGDHTGLARNSVYRYFSSRDEIVAELCERDLPAWLDAVEQAMEAAATVEDQAAAFVVAQLEMVAAGHHRTAEALAGASLGPEAQARIHALTYRPAAQLEAALAGAGHPSPNLTAQLVQGLVASAMRALQAGADYSEVRDTTADVARRAVSSS